MQRLKSRAQFQAALAGQRVASTTHFVLHRCSLAGPRLPQAPADAGATPTQPDGPVVAASHVTVPLFPQAEAVWLGAMVPKRWARRAVTRNAIKRQIYAAGARFEDRLPTAAHVVRLRTTFDRKTFASACSDALKQAVRQELEQLLARAAARAPVAAAPVAGVDG